MKSQFPLILFKLKGKESRVLYLAMFMMGACGLAYEYTLSKVAADILGDSVRQWAVIIGVMMFFMGIGADLQKYIKDTFIVDLFIFFEVLIGLAGAFGPILFIYTYGHYPFAFIIVQYTFIVLIGLIIGLEIPLISRINQHYIDELKLNLAAVLKMDYIGSLAGALAWTFILPLWFEQVQSAFLLGLLNAAVALLALFTFWRLVKRKTLLLTGILLTFIILSFGFFQAVEWRSFSEQFLYRDQVILSKTSRYQHVVLTKNRANDISCYINGHLQFNSVDEHIYHENLVHPAFAIAGRKERILILGGGDGLALREVLKYKSVKEVILCDLDPFMTDLARNNKWFKQLNANALNKAQVTLLKNNTLQSGDVQEIVVESQNNLHGRLKSKVAKINIVNLDAVQFIEQFSGLFDIIILDFPDPNAPDLAKLYSSQFYRQLKTKLAAEGIIVQQSTSPFHAKEVFLSIGRTMQSVGFSAVPYKDYVPSFGEWGWWIAGHKDMILDVTIKEKMSNLKQLKIPVKYLTGDVIKSNLIFGKDQLKTHETAINSIANSMAYYYYLKSWNE